jgi:hypothetical protein
MILRVMPAVASATGMATFAVQVEVDGTNKRGYPGPPGWGLGVRLTTSSCIKIIVTKPYNKPLNVMRKEWKDRARNREAWRHIIEEAKAHPRL